MVRRRPAALHVSVWLHERRSRWRDFRSAVSLHAHTSYSREQLADLPRLPGADSVRRLAGRARAAHAVRGRLLEGLVASAGDCARGLRLPRRRRSRTASNLSPLVSLTRSRRPARRPRRAAGARRRGAPDLVRVDGAVRSRLLPPRRPQPARRPAHATGSRGCRRLHRRARSGAALPALLDDAARLPRRPRSSSTIRGGTSPTSAPRPTPRCCSTSSARTRDRLHALELNGYRSQAENDRVRTLASEVGAAGHLRRRSARLRAERPPQPDHGHHLRRVRRRGPRRLQPGPDHARVPPAPAAADPGVRLGRHGPLSLAARPASTGPIASPTRPTA